MTHVFAWYKEFKGGRERVENHEHDRLSTGQVLSTVFFDQQGILLIDFLHERRTINAAYYCKLLTKVRDAYHRKRTKPRIREVILLHDNARPHTSALIMSKLEEMHWTQLVHPPHSPD